MWIAEAKQATTIATQAALAALDLAVEMCIRPWIVELSRNSRTDEFAIFMTCVYLFIIATLRLSVILTRIQPAMFASKLASLGFTEQTGDLELGGVVKRGEN